MLQLDEKVILLIILNALLLMVFFPVIIANLYYRKVKRSVKSKGNFYTTSQTCWLLTTTGIIMSFMSFAVIVAGFFFLKYFVRDWFGIHVTNNTKDMVQMLGICFVLILSSLTMSGLYIAEFRKHKNDYIRFNKENIDICYEGQHDTVELSQIEKIDIGKKGFDIYLKNGRKLKILKSMVNRLIGRDKLNEKLKELSSLNHRVE